MTERKAWEAKYQHTEEHRILLGPAYRAAAAPLIAGTIDRLNREQVRMLVIGGGNRQFSQRTLPAIKEVLAEEGKKVQISVVESDLADETDSGKERRADLFHLNRDLRGEKFDVVVGESVIHHAERTRMSDAIQSIKSVLSPGGAFIHVQDIAPGSREFLSPESFRLILQRTSDGIYAPVNQEEGHKLAKEAHENMATAIKNSAAENGLDAEFVPLSAVRNVRLATIPEKYRKLFQEANRLNYHHGVMNPVREIAVPVGQVTLSYKGTMAILSETPMQVKKHVSRNGWGYYGN